MPLIIRAYTATGKDNSTRMCVMEPWHYKHIAELQASLHSQAKANQLSLLGEWEPSK